MPDNEKREVSVHNPFQLLRPLPGLLGLAMAAGCAASPPAPPAQAAESAARPLDLETFRAYSPTYRPGMKWAYAYTITELDSTGHPAPAQPTKTSVVEVVAVTDQAATVRTAVSEESPWEETSPLQPSTVGLPGSPAASTMLVGLEAVTVPAGTFPDTLHVRSGRTYDRWYARGVGLIKTIDRVNLMGMSMQTTKELTSFSPGP